MEAFLKVCEQDEKWNKLKDIPIPEQYEWIFGQFLRIWQGCEYDMAGNIILTFRTINEYVECMHVELSVADKKLILMMKSWAVSQIHEMEKEQEEH